MSNGGPTGDVTTAPIWFTHCVHKDDYENFGLDASLVTMGKEGCDYLLGGKLVCLDGTRCAIGTVIHIEPVGYHKSGFETIDNDFCINVLLFPHEIPEFGPGTGPTDKLSNWDQVRLDGVQGALIDERSDMPEPNEPAADETPYTSTYLFGGPGGPSAYEYNEDPAERKLEEVKQDASGIQRIEIPVLHSEFEGSRIFAVCSAIKPFLDAASGGPGAGACRAAIGWVPVFGDAVCTIVENLIAIALAPLMLAAATAAWVSAGAYDELFLTGPISRQVALGDRVIITGRWVWDGGHSGWNELHPTFTLQKIVFPDKTTAGVPADDARAFVDTWCGLVMGVPPSPGEAASGLVTAPTPEQAEVADRQARPEHRWVFHPAIDGCEPEEEEEPIDVPK